MTKCKEKYQDESYLLFYLPLLEKIVKEFSEFNAQKFVGQSSKTKEGMSQKNQIKAIENLKEGKTNIIVCTSVAEEGLDIPRVDLIIFYSPIPSAIRSIQRKGRTGRQEIGRVIILVTKGTKDEAYTWISKRREKQMDSILSTMSDSPRPITLKDFEQKEETPEIKIYSDSRESGILKKLIEYGITVIPKNLEVGDFILSDDVVVERKEVSDFTSSLIDQRLFNQAKELKRNFEKPIMIIEGNLSDIFFSRNVNPDAIRSAMISLTIDYGIPFIFTSSKDETAKYLYLIAKREQIGKKKLISLRGSKKTTSISEMQQFFIEGLPSIGPSLAKSLLKNFKTPKELVNATIDELQKIEKMGPKKAEKIKMIMEEEFVDEV